MTILRSGLALTAGYLLSNFAFSVKTREIIKQRDGYQCVVCGSTKHLQCAHIDHDKSKSKYDDPSNGRLMDVFCHLFDHINRAGRNGLSKQHNDFAIQSLQKQAKIIRKHENQ